MTAFEYVIHLIVYELIILLCVLPIVALLMQLSEGMGGPFSSALNTIAVVLTLTIGAFERSRTPRSSLG